jgi:hypothetical protein
MRPRGHFRQALVRTAALVCGAHLLSGCYIINFLRKDHDGGGGGSTGGVIGQSLGQRAGGLDEAALASVYAATTSHAPAAIRPDPDLYVRRLLRQYRPEGMTIARQIGEVEQFRLLLGGASQDFAKAPQDTYDATSLLAVFRVAQDVCRGLVAPNAVEHEGWDTILPYPPEEEAGNIAWLAQRIIGKPSSTIDASVTEKLAEIMRGEQEAIESDPKTHGSPYAKYIPVCATLTLDAEALYL